MSMRIHGKASDPDRDESWQEDVGEDAQHYYQYAAHYLAAALPVQIGT